MYANVLSSISVTKRLFIFGQTLGNSKCNRDRHIKLGGKFGFFLEALEFGTPPHGGIALGLDRIMALLAGEHSIRETMAFPKTATAVDLMSDAPSQVDEKQLRELHLRSRS